MKSKESMEKVLSRPSSILSKHLGRIVPARVSSALARIFAILSMSLIRVRNIRIRPVQEKLLKANFSPCIRRLIVFLTPGYDIVNGGIISIASIYEETRKFREIHGSETIMCTVPGDPLLLKYTKFKNQNYIYSLSRILSYFNDLEYLMIHVPEYAVQQFLKNITYSDYSRIRKTRDVSLNVMLQNIDMLPSVKYVQSLKKLGRLTCTTAHEKYSTQELSRELTCPLYRLSTFVSPEQYHKRNYCEKENLMIVSPDPHPRRSAILSSISNRFPQLRLQVVKDLTYEEYKKLISRAKWALTFGEGLDGYFVETVFSGGISFSTYNSKFFTEDFKSLRTVYENYDALADSICSDIDDLDNEIPYENYQTQQYDLCHKYYNYAKYIRNLKSFYIEASSAI